jgi:replicative DNA helicase
MAAEKTRELVFRNDPLNEQVVWAAAVVGTEEMRRELASRLSPDDFLTPEHRVVWGAVREASRQRLSPDPATLAKLASGDVDLAYVAEVLARRSEPPDERTLRFHVDRLLWDRQRHTAMVGPVASLLEALERADDPDKVRGCSRAVAASFDGWGDRRYLHDPDELVRAQVADMRQRMAGRAVYPYGLKGLDFYEPDAIASTSVQAKRRMLPGSAPGQVTVVTGVPGAGKSTFTARLTLGLARQHRKVLYGAWEMRGGTTLELLACMSLGWSRTDLIEGRVSDAQLVVLEQRMREIAKQVRFLANPFRRRAGEKGSNARNLDVVQGYIADSGCDVFVADLWKRCLAETKPDDEEEALNRQQAMAEELGVHVILLQQQRLKDVESRPDKRPTREGIKGSGAWTEVADTILGVHRPALWKAQDDVVLEIDVLKQRYGRWPLAVEFDWNADHGAISGGRTVDYDQPGGMVDGATFADKLIPSVGRKKR